MRVTDRHRDSQVAQVVQEALEAQEVQGAQEGLEVRKPVVVAHPGEERGVVEPRRHEDTEGALLEGRLQLLREALECSGEDDLSPLDLGVVRKGVVPVDGLLPVVAPEEADATAGPQVDGREEGGAAGGQAPPPPGLNS